VQGYPNSWPSGMQSAILTIKETPPQLTASSIDIHSSRLSHLNIHSPGLQTFFKTLDRLVLRPTVFKALNRIVWYQVDLTA